MKACSVIPQKNFVSFLEVFLMIFLNKFIKQPIDFLKNSLRIFKSKLLEKPQEEIYE